MKSKKSIIIFVLCVLFFFSASYIIAEWKLRKNNHGIKVYTRDFSETAIKEFKAVSTVNASLEILSGIISELEKYPSWLENCASIDILEDRGTEKICYMVSEAPWPFEDRDAVYALNVTYNTPKLYGIELNAIPDYIEEKEGMVRIKESQGSWRLQYISSFETKVTYRFFADPEGDIPPWILNLFIVDGPFKTIINLKKISKQQ